MAISGHFIASSRGRVFLTVTGQLQSGRAILCLPPLFEEMNLSRAVIAKQAQYFAAHGLPTCVLDYYGTGDSEGNVDEATAQVWLEDIIAAGNWLRQQGAQELVLWGVRFGGLILLHFQNALHDALPVNRQLLWKPVTGGKLYISQFLRLKQASTILHGNNDKVNWRQRIADGNNVEVAGYPLNEPLVSSIEALEVAAGLAPLTQLGWMELGASTITPGVQRVTSSWPASDYRLDALESPQFWQTPETFTVPALYPHSLAMLEE